MVPPMMQNAGSVMKATIGFLAPPTRVSRRFGLTSIERRRQFLRQGECVVSLNKTPSGVQNSEETIRAHDYKLDAARQPTIRPSGNRTALVGLNADLSGHAPPPSRCRTVV
jgi:hypothetical protein